MKGQEKTTSVIFALDPEKVRVNDIVLSSELGLTSWGIRTFTNSDFSHAAICTRNGMLLEAVPKGVIRSTVQGKFAQKIEWIRVLRLRGQMPLDKYGRTVADFAEKSYQYEYSVHGALSSRFPLLGLAPLGELFCSQMVAQAYADAGIVPVSGKTPAQTYPALIMGSEYLEDVSTECIRRIDADENPDLFAAILQIAESTSVDDEADFNGQVFRAIKVRLGQTPSHNVRSLPELWNWLRVNHQAKGSKVADAAILEVLRYHEFFNWYENWLTSLENEVLEIDNLAAMIEAAPREPSTREISRAIIDLNAAIEISSTVVTGRRIAMEEFDVLAQESSLKTFAELSSKFRKEYEVAGSLLQAKKRVRDALVAHVHS